VVGTALGSCPTAGCGNSGVELRASRIKMAVFWHVAPCSLLEFGVRWCILYVIIGYRRFLVELSSVSFMLSGICVGSIHTTIKLAL
jgi:hypothetical protein